MTLRIVAVRHAKPLAGGYAEDSLRPLSEEGVADQRIVVKKLMESGIIPTRILTSPLLRARQTAEIFSDIFAIEPTQEEALGDRFNGDKLVEQFPPIDAEETVVLVGHAPTLAEFVNVLVGEIVLPKGLSKSAAAIVSFEEQVGYGKGQFKGVFIPN